jgi:hypothetical protein
MLCYINLSYLKQNRVELRAERKRSTAKKKKHKPSYQIIKKIIFLQRFSAVAADMIYLENNRKKSVRRKSYVCFNKK